MNPRLNIVTEADVPQSDVRTTSQYRGVSWSTKYEKWIAQVCHLKKNFYIGAFSDEITAAKAVNRKCREIIGPDIKYNDVDDEEYISPMDTLTPGTGRKKRGGSSQYKGVSATQNNTFAIEFRWKGRRYREGRFKTELEAAKRYNALALEVTADEAAKPCLNIISE